VGGATSAPPPLVMNEFEQLFSSFKDVGIWRNKICALFVKKAFVEYQLL